MLLSDLLLLLSHILLPRLLLALNLQELQLGHALLVQRCLATLVVVGELAQRKAALAAEAHNLSVCLPQRAEGPRELVPRQRPPGLPLPAALTAIASAHIRFWARVGLRTAAYVAVPPIVVSIGALLLSLLLLTPHPCGHTLVNRAPPRARAPLHLVQRGRPGCLGRHRSQTKTQQGPPCHVPAVAHCNSVGDGTNGRLPWIQRCGTHLELRRASLACWTS
mmetsp:Transcript_60166/g.188444  ORF Transcript_60166/g.188444 Transcript_60166/m.188444 type:complete len:221 (+) Transcript_60166:166-828(+)